MSFTLVESRFLVIIWPLSFTKITGMVVFSCNTCSTKLISELLFCFDICLKASATNSAFFLSSFFISLKEIFVNLISFALFCTASAQSLAFSFSSSLICFTMLLVYQKETITITNAVAANPNFQRCFLA